MTIGSYTGSHSGRTHFDLYKEGDDRMALMKTIAKEMYAVARPEAKAP